MKANSLRIVSLVSLAFFAAGCGNGVHGLCKRAAECDIIGEDDVDECKSDLNRALDDDVISKDDVADCHQCVENNSCGIDLADCASDCAEVTPIIVGSNIN